jgi:hypothetical protein
MEPSAAVTNETVFSHQTVPLLSALSNSVSGDKPVSDLKRLEFLIKVNQALASGVEGPAAFEEALKTQWKEYKPLVIVGPSGAGKGTLIGKLTQKYPDRFGFSVSFTTRAPRAGEVNGVHYFFVDHDQFKAKIEGDEFIEYC